METNNYLSQNLKAYQELQKLSLVDFSKELDIPLSTLKAILKDGNTTLETLLRISRKLDCSLDMLVYDKDMPAKSFILQHMERAGGWFAAMEPERQDKIARHMSKIWEAMEK